jgi:outer membrane protein OmpA-like peptidoglycan-associated protein
MRLALGLAMAVGSLIAIPLPSIAQNLDPDELVELFKPKPKVATTRGLSVEGKPTTLTREQIGYVRSLGRSIEIEEVEEIAEIIEAVDLPQVDFTIEFEFNSANLTPDAMKILYALGTALKDPSYEQSYFLVAGHTDAKGSDDYNLRLSQDRAYAVEEFLVSVLDVPQDLLRPVGFGESHLKDPYNPNAAENRRVTVVNLAYDE